MAYNFYTLYDGDTFLDVRLSGIDPGYPNWQVRFWIDGVLDATYYPSSSATRVDHSYEGLEPNTRYLIRCQLRDYADYEVYFDDAYYQYTDNFIISPPSFSISNVTSNSAQVNFTKAPDVDSCGIYMRAINSDLNRAMIGDYSTSPQTLTKLSSYDGGGDLQPGTTYYVAMDSYNGKYDVASALSASKSFTTLANVLGTPTLDTSYTQKTHNTISVKANAVANAQNYYFEIWNSTKTTLINTSNSTSLYAYFSGLTAGTQYQIRLKVTATGYTDSAWSSWYAATTTIAAGWNWQHSTLPGDDIALTRTEWLAFQNKINEIRVGRGYTSYTFTTSTSEIYAGKPIKASHFNEAIAAINTMLSSVDDMIARVAGDEITSAFMIELKNKLNSCIV